LRTWGSILPLATSLWGISLIAGLIIVLVILFVNLKPSQIRLLSNTSMALLLASLILALERTRGELSVFVQTLWGLSILVGAVFGMGIFLLGFIIGQNRVMIAIQCQKILEANIQNENSEEIITLKRLRRRLFLLTIPENLFTIIVLAAMIYARYLPG
jgi:ABC-type Fe3+-siderophore transport system permease subunit